MSLITHLRHYSRSDAAADLVAGAITAAVLIPQALAFAALAGLPPQVGLYASVLPPLVYAVLGGSRVMSVGPVSVAALMVASALAGVVGDAARVEAAATLALLVAAFFGLAGLLRAGALTSFISSPVLHGFTSGAAVLIIVSQLPTLLGLAPGQATVNPAIAAVGLGGLVLIFGLQGWVGWLQRRGSPPLGVLLLGRSAAFVAVFVATLAVLVWDLDGALGVPVVGPLAGAWPSPLGQHLVPSWSQVQAMAPAAALIALIAYVESAAIAKVFAARAGETVHANRELWALGGANWAAAASGTMPVAGGFSRTAVNAEAGARSQIATLITVLLLLMATATLADAMAHLPRAVLAAAIIASVVKLIDGRELLRLWRYDRAEAAVFALTAVLTAAVDIEWGLLAGLTLALLWPVWKARTPHIAELGRIPDSAHYRNIERHPTQAWPQLLLARVDGALSAANASHVSDWIVRVVTERRAVEHVVVDAGGIHAIDATALEAIEHLTRDLQGRGVGLHWAELRGPVTDRLERAGQLPRLGPGHRFLNVDVAVHALVADTPPE